MERLIIRLQDGGRPGVCRVSLDYDTQIDGMPEQIARRNKPRALRFPAALATAEPVKVGEKLMTALCRQPAIEWAIQQAMGREQLIPLFLRVEDGGESGDQMPWELLFDAQQSFLALSEHYPVVRSKSLFGKREVERELALSAGSRPEIRVLALLAAADAGWQTELTALEHAVEAGRTLGCDVLIHVLHSARPEDIVAVADKKSGIRFSPFTRVEDLWDAASSDRPNILHFFCHGSVDNGPKLLCARVLYNSVPDERNIVRIAAEDITTNLSRDQNIWMAVLNACSTAKGDYTKAQTSFALQLLGSRVPLVVANRVPVQDSDASVMTQSLYPSVVRKVVSRGSGTGEVEWADSLRPARRALVKSHIGTYTETEAERRTDPWSRPVFYSVPSFPTLRGTDRPNAFDCSRTEVRESLTEDLQSITERPDERITGGSTPASNSPGHAPEQATESTAVAWYDVGPYAGTQNDEEAREDDEAEAPGFATV
jgi:hypothetical protein